MAEISHKHSINSLDFKLGDNLTYDKNTKILKVAEDISYGGRFAWEYNETNDSLDLVVYE